MYVLDLYSNVLILDESDMSKEHLQKRENYSLFRRLIELKVKYSLHFL